MTPVSSARRGPPEDPAGIPLTELAGVGPVRAGRLERLGLSTVHDLLLFAPRGVETQGGRIPAGDALRRVGEDVSVAGTLRAPRLFRRGRRRSVLSATLEDASGSLGVLFFNQPWLLERLRGLAAAGETVELYGRVVKTTRGPALSAPRLATDGRPLPAPGSVEPVYPLTEGIGQGFLRDLCRRALAEHGAGVVEPLPEATRAEHGLIALGDAVREMHRPSSEEGFLRARRRLALERILALLARLERTRVARAGGRARAVRIAAEHLREVEERLPFVPTDAQRRAMREILADLGRTRPMRRLLQGDVGSGKTLVAFFAALAVAAGGGQSALLAPTEILAQQHFHGLRPWLEEAGVRATLLLGSMSRAAQRAARAEIERGQARLAVGTHALLSRSVAFERLDLAIVDEQQRFGVAQKEALLEKGRDVHLLLATATPIPRTLALTLYGDLDQSVIDASPPGRGEVKTMIVPPAKRRRMLGFLAERMQAGEGVFWVCPRIEAGEEGGAEIAAAEQAFRELGLELGGFGVELVHGRIEPEERAGRIARFRSGAARLLVGTSLLEVGVDVPAATVMVVDGAERFGLAQLHQLRGRVGRGPRASWCLLLGRGAGLERVRVLEGTRDGFEIAEEDLRRRGMGDLAGLRQAGLNVEGLADPLADLELVRLARRLVRDDQALAERYAALGEGLVAALV